MADENTAEKDIGALEAGGTAANRGVKDIGALQSAAAAAQNIPEMMRYYRNRRVA